MNGNRIEHRCCTIFIPLLQIILIEGKNYGTDDMFKQIAVLVKGLN